MKDGGDQDIVDSVRTRTSFGVLFFVALVGCTSLLGDFEVTPGSSGSVGEGGACTQCGDKCVDTSVDNANCGACGTTCNGGQTCQASACACPAAQAFCSGRCETPSRQKCGPTCATCATDQICGDACVVAPAARIKPFPHYTVGWRRPNGMPFAVEVESTNAPGTTYECRTAAKVRFNDSTPWGPCDGANGTGLEHRPAETPGAPEGTYRTEHRYRNYDYVSPVTSVEYYVHHALDGVASCPRPNTPTDGPHFTDDQYFASAQAFSTNNPTLFPSTSRFPNVNPNPGPADQMVLRAPLVRLFFNNVRRSPGMRPFSGGDFLWPANGGSYQFEDGSLRHDWRINQAGTLVLVKRAYARRFQYPNPANPGMMVSLNGFTGTDCKQTVKVGANEARFYGPANANRGPRNVECEALVLNSAGAVLCMNPGPMGNVPVPTPFDLAPNPLTGNFGANSLTASGNATVTAPAGTFAATDINNTYVKIPNAVGVRTFKWYRITNVQLSNPQLVQLDQAPVDPSTAAPYPASTLLSYRKAPLAPVLVLPTGYAKIHFDGRHTDNPNVVPGHKPSPGSKCYTPGCTVGSPWLTYLPP